MKAFLELILSLFGKKDPEKLIDLELVEDREDLVIPIEYKKGSQRLVKEFNSLKTKNVHLYNILIELNEFTNREFDKGIVITMIGRTSAEQDYLYRNSAKYKIRQFKSPHQFDHAIDIRSRTFTDQEIGKIVEWLNKNNDQANYYKWTAKAHDVGSGMHFHIQFVRA